MSLKNILLATSLICFCLLMTIECAAQKSKKGVFPRVGTIKNYEATGLMMGCGNYYFVLRKNAKPEGENYVFLARSKGDDAWMNLNGRDVRLKQLKSPRGRNQTSLRFNYSFGKLLISVAIKNRETKNEAIEEDDFMLEIKIILKKGRTVRVIKAFGYTDC